VRRTQAEAGSEARRVRYRFDGRRWFQVARWAEFPKGEERMKGVALSPFALVTFIWGQ
jgi:hypothetical protein